MSARARAAQVIRAAKHLAADGRLDAADADVLTGLAGSSKAGRGALAAVAATFEPVVDGAAQARLRGAGARAFHDAQTSGFVQPSKGEAAGRDAAHLPLSRASLDKLAGADRDALRALVARGVDDAGAGRVSLMSPAEYWDAAARGCMGGDLDRPCTYLATKQAVEKAGLGASFDAMVAALKDDERAALMDGRLAPRALFAARARALCSWRALAQPMRWRRLVESAAQAGRLDDVDAARAAMTPAQQAALFTGRTAPAAIARIADDARSEDIDVVVIGAGMAGLAAAQDLAARGQRVVVLEADSRIGGRTLTDDDTFGTPFDRGAAWLHNAELNPLTPIAEKLGFTTVLDEKTRHAYGSSLTPEAAGHVVTERLDALVEALVQSDARGEDVAASTVKPARDAFDRAAEQELAQLSMSVDPEDLSSRDVARQIEEKGDKFVVEGFGEVVASFGHGVPVKLRTPVSKIRWGKDGVVVVAGGREHRAKAVLITVSTGVLAAGKIEFDPPLPGWKKRAIEGLPMGTFDKIALRFDKDVFAGTKPATMVYDLQNDAAIEFLVKPMGQQMVVGFVGGKFAQELEGKGQKAAIEYALSRLRKIYGPAVDEHFVQGMMTTWGKEPLHLGSFTAAKPGMQRMREKLKKPVAGKLYFAGEACSELWAGCVPGAYITGKDAAVAISTRLEGAARLGGAKQLDAGTLSAAKQKAKALRGA